MLHPAPASAQNTEEGAQAPVAAAPAAFTTLHGSVVNAATGDSLSRALVRLVGEDGVGVLTDGEGRFAIAGVAAGPEQVEVLKPGYLDQSAGFASAGLSNQTREYAHTVVVAPSMPDVIFRMTPSNSIRGVIRLSTGDPARIGVTLLKQVVEDGRTAWRVAGQSGTNLEGVYRFANLGDGTYAISTMPAMESESASNLVEPGRAPSVERNGYASVFYPDAREFSAAARIELHGGSNAEADLVLTLEPFRAVTAYPALPSAGATPGAPGPTGMIYAATVTDREGHRLPYPVQSDATTHTLQAFLPQGLYLMVVSATPSHMIQFDRASPYSEMGARAEEHFSGETEIAVGDHAVPDLRVPLAAIRGSTIDVNLARTGSAAQAAGTSQEGVSILLSLTGDWMSEGMVIDYAEGSAERTLVTQAADPGRYWAHTSLSDSHLCVRSLFAGGADLGREPLTLGIAGPSAPLTLNLRDDCARLTLTLPAAAEGSGLGEEPSYTVYAVPDQDTTAVVLPQTLRPSTGGKITLEGLAPGDYHIYTFDQPVALAYHDRDALPLASQSVHLDPAGSESIVLEVSRER
jgi:carboxypeptidase family protein